MIRIGITDDHQLFLKSLSLMLATFNNVTVVVEALNGKELKEKLSVLDVTPDIILLDVNMPVMNGKETAAWLTVKYPKIKLAALSMNDDDKTIISMIKAGCCAYLLKDTSPVELEKAINHIYERGFYNTDAANINYGKLFQQQNRPLVNTMTEKEKEFLQLACSELTYKQISEKMNISERTVDGYREAVFQKFKVHTRVGLALEAIRQEFVSI